MKILAGIVLYNPDFERLNSNIKGIVEQVDCVLLIDNGSVDGKMFEELKSLYDVELIKNQKNLGVAVAYNQLLEYGRKFDYDWLITLDQDSVANENLIEEYRKYLKDENVGIICPRICDLNRFEKVISSKNADIVTVPENVISSGSCINIDKAYKIHGFDERLFIDFVDTDFQKRMLDEGFKIIRVNTAVLMHEIGHLKEQKFLFWTVLCSNHSAFRRYYMVRNRLYYRKKYYGNIGLLKEKIRLILGTIKICFYESDARDKVKATLKGFEDYKKLLNSNIESRIRKI